MPHENSIGLRFLQHLRQVVSIKHDIDGQNAHGIFKQRKVEYAKLKNVGQDQCNSFTLLQAKAVTVLTEA